MPVMWLSKWLIAYRGGPFDLSDYIVELNNVERNAGIAFLAFISIVYGLGRVYAFHPCFDADYRAWLMRSPYTGGETLPSGPVHLVWKDAVVVAALSVLGAFYGLALYSSIAYMITPYALLHAAAAYEANYKNSAYLVCCCVPFLWYLNEHEVLRWLVPVILYAAAHIQSPRNLRQMVERSAQSKKWIPSETIQILREVYVTINTTGKFANRVDLPVETLAAWFWPFNRLAPKSSLSVPRTDAVFMPIVLTWWFCSLMSLIPESYTFSPKASSLPWGICLGLSAYISVFRVGKYTSGCVSPISILGRIATGRLIVPGFDRVFVTPILSSAVALFATTVMAACNAPLAFLYCVPPSVGLFVNMNFGPSLQTWRLTGGHRLTPAMGAKAGVGYEV
jgi:hypothetical protein